jgi:hypothetical protein
MLRVTINPIRPQKNLQIPEQMPDNEKNQNNPGDRYDEFFANGRTIKGGVGRHGERYINSKRGAVARDSIVRLQTVKKALGKSTLRLSKKFIGDEVPPQPLSGHSRTRCQRSYRRLPREIARLRQI